MTRDWLLHVLHNKWVLGFAVPILGIAATTATKVAARRTSFLERDDYAAGLDLIGAAAAAVIAFLASPDLSDLMHPTPTVARLYEHLLIISALLAWSMAMLTKRYGYRLVGSSAELTRSAVALQNVVGVAGFTFVFLAITYPQQFLERVG